MRNYGRRLKKHYVELEYKGIKTHNPIEEPYEPKEEIEFEIDKLNFINTKEPLPYKSYIFLVKPKMIFDLFEKYGFALFYKNIRNPLPSSLYNEDIVKTINEDPLNFWYFNNGITAITEKIQDFHKDAEKIKINGIQIINGAQTVFSIYSAYKNANDNKKDKMNNNALVTLRLSKSGGNNLSGKLFLRSFFETIGNFLMSEIPLISLGWIPAFLYFSLYRGIL